MIKKLNENSALKFKTLSPEEKARKGILGRLYGPVASCVNPTRNNRKYNDSLWENLFNSDLIKERFANGGIFGQLCHPDYEEVDMEKVACVMPEPPVKDKNGELISYVDILDTPCGRIAYQLAKYGYRFGISSRGTGDLIEGVDGDEVDPDTYNLTAFDLVEIPAVENARLSFVESLDTEKKYGKTLKQRLTEELNGASNEDRKIMEESLKNLDIKLDEGIQVVGKDLKGNIIHNYEVDSDEEAEELKKDLENNAELTGGIHPNETIEIIKDDHDEIVNDKSLDEIKDDFKPPVEKIEKEEDLKEEVLGINEGKEDAKTYVINWAKKDKEVGKTLDPDDLNEFIHILKDDGFNVNKQQGKSLFDLYFETLDESLNEAKNLWDYKEYKITKKDLKSVDVTEDDLYRYANNSYVDVERKGNNYILSDDHDGVNVWILLKQLDLSLAATGMDESISESYYVKAFFKSGKDSQYVNDYDDNKFDNLDAAEIHANKLLKDNDGDVDHAIIFDNNGKRLRTITKESISESNSSASKEKVVERHDDFKIVRSADRFGNQIYSLLDKDGQLVKKDTDFNLLHDLMYKQNESISESCGDKEVEEDDKEVVNDKDLAEELQQMLLKNNTLEKDNLSLQEKLSVCNAKETKLNEELNKYKKCAASLSETAKKVRPLNLKVEELNESLIKKDKIITTNKTRIDKLFDDKKELNSKLKESISDISDLENKVNTLTEELENSKKSINEKLVLITRYKKALKESKNAFINAKAENYGVNKEDVLAKLTESYKLSDVDSVCKELSERNYNMSKLPFKITENVKFKTKKSSNEYITGNMYYNEDDEVSDYLLNIIK